MSLIHRVILIVFALFLPIGLTLVNPLYLVGRLSWSPILFLLILCPPQSTPVDHSKQTCSQSFYIAHIQVHTYYI